MYRLLRPGDIHTYSSMVRAWRRETLARCLPSRAGHLGVTESLLRAQNIGARVVEVPARLAWRGQRKSGLRLAPAILGQLGLMKDAAMGRLGERPASDRAASEGSASETSAEDK